MGVVKKNKTVVRKSPRQHQCKYCYKVFPFPNVLKKHYRVHTGERPYECDICGNRFTHQNTLKNHRLCIHNCDREEDFTCGHCDKKFPIKERLIEHVRIHTGYFPHRYCFVLTLITYTYVILIILLNDTFYLSTFVGYNTDIRFI